MWGGGGGGERPVFRPTEPVRSLLYFVWGGGGLFKVKAINDVDAGRGGVFIDSQRTNELEAIPLFRGRWAWRSLH
jgi:hypothetical protein